MRVWVGNRIADATTAVFAFDQPVRPSLDEVGELLRELRQLNDDPTADLARQVDFVTRKRDLIERIEASERPVPEVVPLHPPAADRPFDWGEDEPGTWELARAILHDAVGDPPPNSVVDAYATEVVGRLPRDQFRLDAAEVNEWLLGQELFVEAELAAHRCRLDGARPAMRLVAPGETPLSGAPDEVPEDPATASALIAACEQAWADIQRHHPDVPHAVVVLGSGVERGRLVKLGHWWGGRWLADGEVRGEVLLAGEALHLPAEQVFEVLLHEAAHGINAAMHIKDASRGGRYHNKKFRAMAERVGLDVSVMAPYGWARTVLTPETADRYADAIDRLGSAMRLARTIERGTQLGAEADQEGRGGSSTGTDRSGAENQPRPNRAATCGCGRRMRMAPSVLAAGPVLCGLCGNEFRVGRDASRSAEPPESPGQQDAAVVDHTFVSRRRGALARDRQAGAPIQPQALLAAFLAGAREAGFAAHPAVMAMAQRHHLPAAGNGAEATEPVPHLTAVQRAGLVELVVAGDKPGDWAVAGWYQARGTEHEAPMMAGNLSEAGRRRNLARAMLKGDGTLHGPAIEVLGREFLAGEEIVVGPLGLSALDLEPGIPGRVTAVDVDGRWLDVDFPTAGNYRFLNGSFEAAALSYGYSEIVQGLDRVDLRTVDLRDPQPPAEVAPTPSVALPEIDL